MLNIRFFTLLILCQTKQFMQVITLAYGAIFYYVIIIIATEFCAIMAEL